jgi:hypothetical protein
MAFSMKVLESAVAAPALGPPIAYGNRKVIDGSTIHRRASELPSPLWTPEDPQKYS